MTNVSRETNSLLAKEDCVLVVIDVQEKLMPAISNREVIIENTIKLVKFARMVGVPIILTEQEKLGPTVPDLKKELSGILPVKKLHFNCFFSNDFSDQVERSRKNTIILAGVEAHICIAQTALSALPRFTVHIISDAISSRTQENLCVSIERMRQSGVIISSTEMFIYELLQKAGTDEFRAVLQLVK